MAKRVFFSYHPEQDSDRAQTVVESLENTSEYEAASLVDVSEWEQRQEQSRGEIEEWITRQILDTTVTVVLIGNETVNSELVHLQIEESWEQENGIVGIYVHNIEDDDGRQAMIDGNPLDLWRTETDKADLFSDVFETYYWWRDDGYEHIGEWIEEASERAPGS